MGCSYFNEVMGHPNDTTTNVLQVTYSVNWLRLSGMGIICLGTGLSPDQREAITWTNDGL